MKEYVVDMQCSSINGGRITTGWNQSPLTLGNDLEGNLIHSGDGDISNETIAGEGNHRLLARVLFFQYTNFAVTLKKCASSILKDLLGL